MGETTHISWADHTFNPWIGCARVSPACDGCYAAALMGDTGRHKRAIWGGPGKGGGTRVRTKTWRDPIRWDRAAGEAGTRPFVFCASLADIFDNEVPEDWRREAFDLMRATPNLVWLLLTKRPGMIVKLAAAAGGLPKNAAIGCTVVNQDEADRDIPKLLIAKRATRPLFAFLSMEPLLGPVDLTTLDQPGGYTSYDALRAYSDEQAVLESGEDDAVGYDAVDWVIVGGETSQGGHEARPMRVSWVWSLRDQCAAAGVLFHFKQWGSWDADALAHTDMHGRCPPPRMKIGAKRSGRLVQGVVHDARPVVA